MTTGRDLLLALDPAEFMSEAGFPPDPWQREFLRSTARRHLLLTSRQTGKSTVTAALASHTALYQPGSLVLLIAPSQQQSRELYRKVVAFHREAADLDPAAESAQRLELPNGSRIVSLSGNPMTLRGFSGPRLVIFDEAAFSEDELFAAARPMMAAGGRLVAMSTPNGRRGWFWRAWENEGDAWARTRVTAHDSPRLTAEFLATERDTMPDFLFRQEYLTEFVDTSDQLFASADLMAMSSADVPAVPFNVNW